ncbi:MAG TPA: hypothetical protein VJN89_13720 [Candidatus Acidoferrum sp.]|nr:hypothetical protein [Candidatus Acidoferrum sp.]
MARPKKAGADEARRKEVRRLFVERIPPGGRIGSNLLKFYGWLERNYPELLPQERGDPYELLKEDLKGLYVD